MNKQLRLESVMSAMPWITWWNSPGLLPPFCILQAIKKWRCRRPGNEANMTTVVAECCHSRLILSVLSTRLETGFNVLFFQSVYCQYWNSSWGS